MGWFFDSGPEVVTCRICNGNGATRRNTGKWVGDSAYGGWLVWEYHDECVSKVLAHPECYSGRTVDYAIEIADSLREEKEARVAGLKRNKDFVDSL